MPIRVRRNAHVANQHKRITSKMRFRMVAYSDNVFRTFFEALQRRFCLSLPACRKTDVSLSPGCHHEMAAGDTTACSTPSGGRELRRGRQHPHLPDAGTEGRAVASLADAGRGLDPPPRSGRVPGRTGAVEDLHPDFRGVYPRRVRSPSMPPFPPP